MEKAGENGDNEKKLSLEPKKSILWDKSSSSKNSVPCQINGDKRTFAEALKNKPKQVPPMETPSPKTLQEEFPRSKKSKKRLAERPSLNNFVPWQNNGDKRTFAEVVKYQLEQMPPVQTTSPKTLQEELPRSNESKERLAERPSLISNEIQFQEKDERPKIGLAEEKVTKRDEFNDRFQNLVLDAIARELQRTLVVETQDESDGPFVTGVTFHGDKLLIATNRYIDRDLVLSSLHNVLEDAYSIDTINWPEDQTDNFSNIESHLFRLHMLWSEIKMGDRSDFDAINKLKNIYELSRSSFDKKIINMALKDTRKYLTKRFSQTYDVMGRINKREKKTNINYAVVEIMENLSYQCDKLSLILDELDSNRTDLVLYLNDKNSDNIHAEMRILQYFYDAYDSQKMAIPSSIYLGLSKKACYWCAQLVVGSKKPTGKNLKFWNGYEYASGKRLEAHVCGSHVISYSAFRIPAWALSINNTESEEVITNQLAIANEGIVGIDMILTTLHSPDELFIFKLSDIYNDQFKWPKSLRSQSIDKHF